jgi:hypothetical protein
MSTFDMLRNQGSGRVASGGGATTRRGGLRGASGVTPFCTAAGLRKVVCALELRVDFRKLLGKILDKRRRERDLPHRKRSVLEGSAGYLHERMLVLWIREDPHTVGYLRGVDGIGNCRNPAGLDLLPERGGGHDLHRLNPPVVLAVGNVHPRLAPSSRSKMIARVNPSSLAVA